MINEYKRTCNSQEHLEDFDPFLLICLTELKDTLMIALRCKIIQSMFESIDDEAENSLITRYEIWSFGGAAIKSCLNQYKNMKHRRKYMIPAIARMIETSKENIVIPERLREENR
eukprot:554302_1